MFGKLHAQNLMKERIRKLSGRKKGVFLQKGIFHNGNIQASSELKGIRHSYSPRIGHERIVFDFKKKLPRLYGYISKKDKKVYFDCFKTKIFDSIGSFGNSKYVKEINFFPIDNDSLSVEIAFKEKVGVDIFYLKSPDRLIFDVKK